MRIYRNIQQIVEMVEIYATMWNNIEVQKQNIWSNIDKYRKHRNKLEQHVKTYRIKKHIEKYRNIQTDIEHFRTPIQSTQAVKPTIVFRLLFRVATQFKTNKQEYIYIYEIIISTLMNIHIYIYTQRERYVYILK